MGDAWFAMEEAAALRADNDRLRAALRRAVAGAHDEPWCDAAGRVIGLRCPLCVGHVRGWDAPVPHAADCPVRLAAEQAGVRAMEKREREARDDEEARSRARRMAAESAAGREG